MFSEKAARILRKMQDHKALKYRKRSANPERRDKILNEFNRDNLDDVGPVGGEDRMKVLQEIKEMDEEHDQHIQDIGSKVTVTDSPVNGPPTVEKSEEAHMRKRG